MPEFINNCILGYERISSEKINNIKPKYIICNSYGDYEENPNII